MRAQLSPFDEIVQTLLAPLSAPARAAMTAFAGFGREAQAIARDAGLPAARRQALIDGLDSLLGGRKPEVPLALPVSAAARDFILASQAAGADIGHARHLLQALRQDCVKPRYRDWGEWLLFARFAAAPYGRFLIEAAGEAPSALPAAEALACALLLLTEVQDCAGDYAAEGKVYLPERWLRDHGAEAEALAAREAGPAWRAVFDDAARAAEQLLMAAAPLPGLLRHRPLRGAGAAALLLTRRWAHRLAKGDSLQGPVRLSGLDRLRARWAGTWQRVA
jgi:farnesyl-diphosphate farnesyltransferase